MGLADASTGLTGGELEGNDSLQLKLGGARSLFVGGRLAGVASGELDGKRVLGGFFKSLKITANKRALYRSLEFRNKISATHCNTFQTSTSEIFDR